MAHKINKDAVYRAAKCEGKDYLINDGGLYLLVTTNGAKWWRFVYTFAGKQKNYRWASIRVSLWSRPGVCFYYVKFHKC